MAVAQMMSLRLTPLLIFLLLSGIVAQTDWAVKYTHSYICAVRGSTVTIGCRYKPNSINSSNYTVHSVYWSEYFLPNSRPQDLSSNPAYKGRVQYLRETPQDCSLRIRNVVQEDQLKYYTTFKTSTGEVFQEHSGVKLSVTALRIQMIPDSVFEGDEVTLKCITSCHLTETPTFTWYKHGRNISYNHSSDMLHLSSVSQTDTRDYRCAVQELSYRSPALNLDVRSGDRQGSAWKDAGHIRNFLVAVGVILCGSTVVLAGHFYRRWKKQKTSDYLNAEEDIYTSPDYASRSINNMYQTLNTVYANSANDTYTALDIQTRSSNDMYNTLTAVSPSPPGSWTSSPDYDNLPVMI